LTRPQQKESIVLKMAQTLNKLGRHAKAVAALVLVAAALQMLGCNSFRGDADSFVTIGAIFPLSNDFSVVGTETVTWGIHSAFGTLIAKETINRGDGVLGKKLDVIIFDGEGNPKTAIQRYDDHKNNGVVAIIGPPIGVLANMMSEKAKNDGLPFLMQTLSQQQMAARKDYYKGHAAIKDLSKTYYVNFGYEPPPAATAACECVLVLADAISMAGGTNKKELISAIDKINQKILSNHENSKK
jgi:hypothetical protein